MFEKKEKIIKQLLEALGPDAQLHLVGGAVRDELLGKPAKDFDFATVLHPPVVCEKLTAKNIQWIPTGIRRGTITALIEDEPVEITTFRNYTAENTFTETIEEDLSARDLTINAIAGNVHTGEIIDPFGGKEDLENRILRTVGDPLFRFSEDPHRIIRLVRFKFLGGHEWSIDPATEKTARLLSQGIKFIANERIHDELVKILALPKPKEAFHLLQKIGALEIILPELEKCVGFEQNKFHRFDVFNHILETVDRVQPILTLRLAALLHDIAKPDCLTVDENGDRHFLEHEDVGEKLAEKILLRLKFGRKEIDEVKLLIRTHMRDIDGDSKSIRRLIRAVGDLLPLWNELKRADRLAGHILEGEEDIRWEKFLEKQERELEREKETPSQLIAIGGKDLIEELGLRPGPIFGEVLRHCQEVVLDSPELNVKERLIQISLEFIKEKNAHN